MIRVQIAHTADLTHIELKAAGVLLDAAFDDMADDDWEHALGGMHALLWRADVLVGHASVVQRRLIHGSEALRTGYVEAGAVDSAFRRQGYRAAMLELAVVLRERQRRAWCRQRLHRLVELANVALHLCHGLSSL